MKRILIKIILVSVLAVAAHGKGEDFLKDFWDESAYHSVQISPDGRFVSYMERRGPIDTLHVRDFARNAGYALSSERDAGLASYSWVDAETLAIQEISTGRGQMPRSYISTYNYKLRRLNADFNRPSRLSMEKSHRDIMPEILAGLPQQEGIFLIAEPTVSFFYNPGRARSQFDAMRAYVHRLDARTGELTRVITEPEHDYYIPTLEGKLLTGLKIFGEGKGIYHRHTEQDTWRKLALPEGAVAGGYMPGDELLLVSYRPEGEDKIVLQAYDVKNRKWASKPIADPEYDIVADGNEIPNFIRNPATGQVVGIQYDRDKPKFVWFDPTYQQVQQIYEKAFPGAVISIIGHVAAKNAILAHVSSDTFYGSYIFFNLETQELEVFMESRPTIKDYRFNKMRPVVFEARDGGKVHAYMTLPADYREGKPVPFVVNVKGGPMGRQTWPGGAVNFFEAQWHSLQGYGVLQVNYRGSTGYGLEYSGETTLHAAQKGVEDVIDGTRWAIEQGYAKAGSIVLMGASFGGYVSGMAPAVEPDLFAITLPAMGVYDWLAMIDFDKRISHPFIWEGLKDMYGDYETLTPQYHQWSPTHNADKIRIPLFLLHGKYDARVDEEQAKLFERALKDAGVDYERYYYTRGGHGFGDQEGWVDYFTRINDFIYKYVPPRS